MNSTVEVSSALQITVKLNGQVVTAETKPLETLAEFIRNRFNLTGTHIGCEIGTCGACTVLVDSQVVRSCLTLALQIDGAEIVTIEALSDPRHPGHRIQNAFISHSALQCGYCTPGVLMTSVEFLNNNPKPTREEIRKAIDSNICRCGAYQNIVDAIFEVSRN